MIKASFFFIHGDYSAGDPAEGELQCSVLSFSSSYCHLLAGCSLARAITTIITAADSAAGEWGIITIIMAIATITIIIAIIGNYDKNGKGNLDIRGDEQQHLGKAAEHLFLVQRPVYSMDGLTKQQSGDYGYADLKKNIQ